KRSIVRTAVFISMGVVLFGNLSASPGKTRRSSCDELHERADVVEILEMRHGVEYPVRVCRIDGTRGGSAAIDELAPALLGAHRIVGVTERELHLGGVLRSIAR